MQGLWALLYSKTPEYGNIALNKDVTDIGRISVQYLTQNRLISNIHLTISRSPMLNGKRGAIITDRSTNGTWLNHERLKNSSIVSSYDCITLLEPNSSHSIEFLFVEVSIDLQETECGGPQSLFDFEKFCGAGGFGNVWRVANKKMD
ncbi:FHA domain-containing protein [Entamoeba marina]